MRSALKDILDQTCQVIKAREENFPVFKDDQNIFIVKSGNMRHFNKLIDNIRAVNPAAFLYVLTHSRDANEVLSVCRGAAEVITYSHGGNYILAKLAEQVSYLRTKPIDRFVLLYNNRYGVGYQNIEEILVAITNGPFYAFNSYDELLKVERPGFHLASLRLMNELANWHWEYLGEKMGGDYSGEEHCC